MKEPTGEILTAYATALSSITYNSTTWHVYKEQPPIGKRNYIYLAEVVLNENSAKDIYIFSGTIIIQISTKKDKYCKTIANSLSNSILVALIKVKLSMTSFDMIIASRAQDVSLSEEIESDTNYIKQIALTFETQQK